MANKSGAKGAKIGRGTRSPSSKAYRNTNKAEKNRAARIAKDARMKAKHRAKKAAAKQAKKFPGLDMVGTLLATV